MLFYTIPSYQVTYKVVNGTWSDDTQNTPSSGSQNQTPDNSASDNQIPEAQNPNTSNSTNVQSESNPQEPITIETPPASTKTKVKKNKVTISWKKIKKNKKTKALLGKIKAVQVQYSTDPEFKENVVTKTYKKK
jgi:hypothetical protein